MNSLQEMARGLTSGEDDPKKKKKKSTENKNTATAGAITVGTTFVAEGTGTGLATAFGTAILRATPVGIALIAFYYLSKNPDVKIDSYSIPLPASDISTYFKKPLALPYPFNADKPIEFPIVIPSNGSGNPTKVYEIGGWSLVPFKWVTLKYGVASSFYDTYGGLGNRRPDSQLGGVLGEELRRKYPHLMIRQVNIAVMPNKESAHDLETFLVSLYSSVHGEPPPEQGLPKPKTH